MAPPPMMKAVLPDKFIPPGTARNNRQGGGEGVVTSGADNPDPNEEQLSAAYTIYLQQLLLNKLTNQMASLYSKVEADKCAEVGIGAEIVSTGSGTVPGVAPLALLVKKAEHLLRTDGFVKIYSELAHAFENEKAEALDALQASLETKFNNIVLKDMEGSSPSKLKPGEEIDLPGLIERVREYLKPQEKPQDVRSFMASFLESFKRLLEASAKAEEVSTSATKAADTLMDLTSMNISYSMLSKRQRKRLRKKNSQTLNGGSPDSD